ncbi:MAG: hypothetical protein ACREEH_01445 [Caulobacteraceae bacterium]
MATTYSAPGYTANYGRAGPTGFSKTPFQLHDTAAVGSPVINDVVNFGYLPNNAIVTACVLKAASQLDSNGSPTLTYDVGVTGTAQLFKAAVTTVGRASGASADATVAAAGMLYKNTTGADQLVIVTAHAGAMTGAAGTLELQLEYFFEPTAGSQA